jgi:hypothetical protein
VIVGFTKLLDFLTALQDFYAVAQAAKITQTFPTLPQDAD